MQVTALTSKELEAKLFAVSSHSLQRYIQHRLAGLIAAAATGESAFSRPTIVVRYGMLHYATNGPTHYAVYTTSSLTCGLNGTPRALCRVSLTTGQFLSAQTVTAFDCEVTFTLSLVQQVASVHTHTHMYLLKFFDEFRCDIKQSVLLKSKGECARIKRF
jgi:hypothetical protein